MKNIIEQASNQLRHFLHRPILAVDVDGQFLNNESESITFGEKIRIYFSDNKSLEITTDDIPHFYGEGDLDLQFESNACFEEQLSQFKNKSISGIKIFIWESKGIKIFSAVNYLVQIEFYHNNELLLSSGFFYFDQNSKKMECLITGELSANFKYNLSINDYEKNLLMKEIT